MVWIDAKESLERFAEELEFLNNYEENVSQAVKFLSMNTGGFKPEVGITLGSGMGSLSEIVDDAFELDFSTIPNLPTPKINGHAGKLIFGYINKTPVAIFSGRTHYYDFADGTTPNPMRKVVFPIYVLAGLGARNYIGMNAAGGLNPDFGAGNIMVVASHIDGISNPLLGRMVNIQMINGKPQQRFPDMSHVYNFDISRRLASDVAEHQQKAAGVLLAIPGPAYETPAEALLYRSWRADAVGMSNVPELITAHSLGMECTGISIISNVIDKNGINKTSHDAVLENVGRASKKVAKMFRTYF